MIIQNLSLSQKIEMKNQLLDVCWTDSFHRKVKFLTPWKPPLTEQYRVIKKICMSFPIDGWCLI
jgi:triacylglycerol esterase/lipase EstA (alpha/beta hydrolase family)